MKRNWISVITNLAYPIAGWLAGPVTGFTFTVLGLASAGFHWHEHKRYALGTWWKQTAGYHWQKADEISMYLAFWTIIYLQLGGGWLLGGFCAAMLAIMGLLHNLFDKTAVGLLAMVGVAIKIGGSGLEGFIPLGLFAVALALRQAGEDAGIAPDLMHGSWHLLTAAAMYLLLLP